MAERETGTRVRIVAHLATAFVLFSLFCFRGLAHLAAMQSFDPEEIRRAVQAALAEDIGNGDVTTLATVPENATLKVVMRAREVLVAAGLPLAEAAFRELSPEIKIEPIARDGQHAKPGDILLRISGNARAERSTAHVTRSRR